MCNRDMEDFLYLRTRYDKEQYLSRLETALGDPRRTARSGCYAGGGLPSV